MENMKPYTYYIGWSAIGKYYYGVKYGFDADPNTFWKNYFTSSKYVKEIREKHGEPDIVQIRRTFDTPQEAILWENKVLHRLDAIHKPQWLNKHNGKALYHDEEVRAKQSRALKGQKRTKEQRENNRRAQLGKKLSQKHKDKIAKANKGRKRSALERDKHKKFVCIYSKNEDKFYTYDSWNTLFEETGVSHMRYRQMQKGGWLITKKYRTARWPWNVGDFLTIVPGQQPDV